MSSGPSWLFHHCASLFKSSIASSNPFSLPRSNHLITAYGLPLCTTLSILPLVFSIMALAVARSLGIPEGHIWLSSFRRRRLCHSDLQGVLDVFRMEIWYPVHFGPCDWGLGLCEASICGSPSPNTVRTCSMVSTGNPVIFSSRSGW